MVASLSAHAPYLWLVAASLIAGVINAMAGGGSFISFPAMLAIGVPPIQANATNTVALWPGQLASVWALHADLRRDLLAVVVTASILGGVGGAFVLLHTPQITFMHMVPWLLLSASVLFGVEEMNSLNSLKVLAACLSNFCAVATFVFGGAIVWHYCLISMVFAGIGGYVGARYARRMNANVLRTIVVVTGCVMAAYFFWRQA